MRLGIRQKLFVLVLVTTVPLLLLVGINLYLLFGHLQHDQLDQHVRDARIVAASLERFVGDASEVAKTAGLAVTATGRVDPAAASAYLGEAGAGMPVSDISFFDPQGRAVAGSARSIVGSDVAGDPDFQRVLAGASVSVTPVRREASGRLGFVVFRRIERGGKLLGVTGVSIDAKDLAQVIPTSVMHGTTYVADREGTLFFASRSELASAAQAQGRALRAPGVAEALAGREYTTRDTRLPGLGGGWLGGVVPVGNPAWAVGVFDASGAAVASVSSVVVITLAFVAVVVAASLLGARQYGLGITRPIERLTAATNEIEHGRFDTEVPVATRDEIGELADNFREMQGSLKRTLSDVQVLGESARWMSSTLDLDAIVHAADDYLERILGARAVVVTLFEEGKRPDTVLTPRLSAEAAADLTAAGASAADSPGFARRGYVVLPYEPAGALAEAVPRARTLVALALVVNRRLIGRIDVLAAASVPLREFAQADVPLAASIAQQVAAAAENARLFEQQRLIADTLQDALLTEPYPIPELDIGLVYRQATVGGRIGGDFYDFIPVSRGRTAVIIGDITGKGLEAARFTTIGKGALRAFALEDADPAATLGRASRVIADQIGFENFVTAVYVLVDLRRGRLTYSVAGHPPPVLLRAAGGFELLGGGGVPLGVESPLGYEDYQATMEPGDRILLYTDGLSEARRGLELFGIERIGEVFEGFGDTPVQEVAAGIGDAAVAFAGGALGDDLAIIVIERRAAAATESAGTTPSGQRHPRTPGR